MLCVNLSYPYFWGTPVAKYFTGFFHIPLATFLRCPEFNGGVWRVKALSLNFDRQFPIPLLLTFIQDNQKWKVDAENKVDHPRFTDEQTVWQVQDEDYDKFRTPDTSRVDETSFTKPDTNEATSTMQLRQKVKRDKSIYDQKKLKVR